MSASPLTHFDAAGQAHMVDVGAKATTQRVARAEGRIRMAAATLALVKAGSAAKGDVVGVARIAAIQGAKRCADLVPLCHPLPLTKAAVTIAIDDAVPGFRVEAEVKTVGVTGVEMEALTAVSVACMTLFDMLKAIDRTMVIEGVEVTAKTGGKSGSWQR